MYSRIPMLFFVNVITLIFFHNLVCAEQNLSIRSKIGIQLKSKDQVKQAKKKQKIKIGDSLRIFILPEKAAHVYVVHSDHQTATLLNKGQEKIKTTKLILPGDNDFFQADGMSTKESITILCSHNELKKIGSLFESGSTSHEKWTVLEKAFTNKYRVNLTRTLNKPIALAGNVRGFTDNKSPENFIENLRTYSGKDVLIKKYEFSVQK